MDNDRIHDRYEGLKNIILTHKRSLWAFAYGALIGIVIFCYTYGVRVLDVHYDAWLLNGYDLTQHYLGWCLYRDSPWTFPFGLTSEYIFPKDISIMYADVIPIFAVFFKSISPLLPETFQYFGLWGILCYALQGGFAAVLLKKFIPSIWLSSLLSIFFVVGSPMMIRMFGHTALGGQWVLLLSMLFLVYRDSIEKAGIWRCIWFIMGSLCVWIHGYFLPMVFFVMLCFIVLHYWIDGANSNAESTDCKQYRYRESFILIGGYVASAAVSMWLLGGFSSDVQLGTAGVLGQYTANLNAFFNPIYPSASVFLEPLPFFDGQYEGYAYLGFGGILMVLAAAAKWLMGAGYKNISPSSACVAGLWLLAFVLSIVPIISLNDYVVLEIVYPPGLNEVMAIFRANGRFIWIAEYLMLIFSISILSGKCEKKNIVLLMMLLMIQVVDFSYGMDTIRKDYTGTSYMYALNYDVDLDGNKVIRGRDDVDILARSHKYVAYTDWHYVMNSKDAAFAVSYYGCANSTKLTAYYLARMPAQYLDQQQEDILSKLKSGMPDGDTLYVIADRNAVSEFKGLVYYEIGDILFGTVKEIPSMELYRVYFQ